MGTIKDRFIDPPELASDKVGRPDPESGDVDAYVAMVAAVMAFFGAILGLELFVELGLAVLGNLDGDDKPNVEALVDGNQTDKVRITDE